jgi:hypothetical protein
MRIEVWATDSAAHYHLTLSASADWDRIGGYVARPVREPIDEQRSDSDALLYIRAFAVRLNRGLAIHLDGSDTEALPISNIATPMLFQMTLF